MPLACAGWIEDKPDGRTVIHLSVYALPDPSDPGIAKRASVEVVKRFRERFPDLFAERWRDLARAHPDLYGKHNWDRVEVALQRSTGITVQGVESDLLQIAGGIAPDVLFINFRKSDTYIRNRFLHPLDEYFAHLTPEEKADRIHPKIANCATGRCHSTAF
jgi:multiple sugar transport system permease protein